MRVVIASNGTEPLIIEGDGVTHTDHPGDWSTLCGINYSMLVWGRREYIGYRVPVTCLACIALEEDS